MKSFLKFFGLILVVGIIFSGCTVRFGSGPSGGQKGVWKSLDAGKTWEQKAAIPTVGEKKANIGGVDVRRIVFDPQDFETLYLATESNGIFYSYDGGESWRQFSEFAGQRVRSIAVHPNSKCILYAISQNKIFRSNDCGRSWETIYYHQDHQVVLTDILIDFYAPGMIYLSSSAGEVLKSFDGGYSWTTIHRVDRGVVVDLVGDPDDSRIIYAATVKNGIYRTKNGGRDWQSLGEGLRQYSGSHNYRQLAVAPATPGSLFLVSQYGMLKSLDRGDNWELVELLPASKEADIQALAVNPKDSNEIYYSAQNSLVKSVDGGKSWSSRKFPFNGGLIANEIAINPENSETVYLGVFKAK